MVMVTRIQICNDALSEIRATLIQSIEENSLSADECRRHYPNVIAEILEGPHDWSAANRRVALAELATNDREGEWLYAYQVPSDVGTPIRVIPDLSGLGLGVPVGWLTEPYVESWANFGPLYETPYLIQNSVLYSNQETAILEYGINAIEEVEISQMLRRAITLELASRLAMPLKQDKEMRQQLKAEAEIMIERAMADDQNRHPRRTGEYVSEALAARTGAI